MRLFNIFILNFSFIPLELMYPKKSLLKF